MTKRRTEGAALDIPSSPGSGPFQKQSFSSGDGRWTPMEDGAAAHHWRPVDDAVDAVAHCLAWTGFICIPAMQVVDLATGLVVWRGSDRYPEAGPSITPQWEADAVAAARARLDLDVEPEEAPQPAPVHEPVLDDEPLALW